MNTEELFHFTNHYVLLDFSPDLNYCVIATEAKNNNIFLLNLQSYKIEKYFYEGLPNLMFSSDSLWIIDCEQRITKINLASKKKQIFNTYNTMDVSNAQIYKDCLFVCDFNEHLSFVRRIEKTDEILSVTDTTNREFGIVNFFVANEKIITLAIEDRKPIIFVYSLADNSLISYSPNFKYELILSGKKYKIDSYCCNYNMDVFIVSYRPENDSFFHPSEHVCIYNANGDIINEYDSQEFESSKISYNPFSEEFISVSYSKNKYLRWDIKTNSLIGYFSSNDRFFSGVDFRYNNRFLIPREKKTTVFSYCTKEENALMREKVVTCLKNNPDTEVLKLFKDKIFD